MDRIVVESSLIRTVGFDTLTSILEIEFCGGKVYEYSNIPAAVYLELISAPSIGRYFNLNIRNAAYECRRLS